MAFRKNTAIRTVQADALADIYDGGTVKIYTGSQPADPNSAASGTLLATITIPTPAFGAAVAGVVTLAGVWSVNASVTGTAGYARVATSDGLKWFDVIVSDIPGGNNLLISDLDIVATNLVQVTSLTITVPES
jgi:hypothetical protein